MNELLRNIPKIDNILSNDKFKELNPILLAKVTKKYIDKLRKSILSGNIKKINTNQILNEIEMEYRAADEPTLKPLINATGVIIHTNFGRSLISKELLNSASNIICNYSNLEYEIDIGKRGERYEHITKELQNLLGVESALVVNNNASAVFLILNTFAKNKEVIVSRGELVEIGGSFRIPEVMKESGAILKEIGTTNKTKIEDYEKNITDNTTILMKVHKSNFDIVGFSQDVSFADISKLSKEKGIIDYYDLGSGYIPELPYRLSQKEPSLHKILQIKPSLISFSGDKLFGSSQAGIIIGKKKYIEKLKQNQLLRMLRVDKITLSILQETIRAYLKREFEKIPTLNMLYTSIETLRQRADYIKNELDQNIEVKLIETTTFVGGGTMPNRSIPTIALAFSKNAKILEEKFRKRGLIGRIENDNFLIDFRSILPKFDIDVLNIIKEVYAQ